MKPQEYHKTLYFLFSDNIKDPYERAEYIESIPEVAPKVESYYNFMGDLVRILSNPDLGRVEKIHKMSKCPCFGQYLTVPEASSLYEMMTTNEAKDVFNTNRFTKIIGGAMSQNRIINHDVIVAPKRRYVYRGGSKDEDCIDPSFNWMDKWYVRWPETAFMQFKNRIDISSGTYDKIEDVSLENDKVPDELEVADMGEYKDPEAKGFQAVFVNIKNFISKFYRYLFIKLPVSAALSMSQYISREYRGKPMGDIETKEYTEEGKLGLGKTILYFLLSCIPTLSAMFIHPFAGFFTNLLTFWFALRNNRVYFASVTIVGTLLSIFTSHLPDIGLFLKMFYLSDVNNTIDDKGKHIKDFKPVSLSDGRPIHDEPYEGPDGDIPVSSKSEETKKDAEEKVEEAKEMAEKKLDETKKIAEEKVEEAKEMAEKKLDETKKIAEEKVEEAKEMAEKKLDETKKIAEEKAKKLAEKGLGTVANVVSATPAGKLASAALSSLFGKKEEKKGGGSSKRCRVRRRFSRKTFHGKTISRKTNNKI
jgi:hypothetical protein